VKTGFYIRIERAGTWGPVDIGEMSDAELEEFFRWLQKESPDRVLQWSITLAKTIRDLPEPSILAERVENEVADGLEQWLRALPPSWREDVGLNATEEIADFIHDRGWRLLRPKNPA